MQREEEMKKEFAVKKAELIEDYKTKIFKISRNLNILYYQIAQRLI